MKNTLLFSRYVIGIALLAALFVVSQARAGLMNWADRSAESTRIKGEYKSDKMSCQNYQGNLRDVCQAEAKGKERVAYAELQHARSGKVTDADKVIVAKADAAYAVAKEKCDDSAGNVKDVCRAEAKAAHAKSKAEVKMTEKISEAQSKAVSTGQSADLHVALEKCDVMSGDPKKTCVETAKNQYKSK
jgi:hypothetical protein